MRYCTLLGTDGRVIVPSVACPAGAHERTTGLIGADRLSPWQGLWLPRAWCVHTFGMRRAIDLVFIDHTGRVRAVRTARPRRLHGRVPGAHVLELGAGVASAAGLARGVRVRLGPARAHP